MNQSLKVILNFPKNHEDTQKLIDILNELPSIALFYSTKLSDIALLDNVVYITDYKTYKSFTPEQLDRLNQAKILLLGDTLGHQELTQLFRQGIYDYLLPNERWRVKELIEEARMQILAKLDEIFYKAMLDSTMTSIYAVDIDHNLVAFNEVFAREMKRILGFEIAVGQNIMHQILPEEREFWLDFRQELTKKEHCVKERRYYYQQEVLAFEIFGKTVRQANGKLIGFTHFSQDITLRDKAIGLQERYHNILNQLPIHVFEKDAFGQFTFMNQKALNILNLKLEDVIGKTDYDIFPQKTAQKLTSHDQLVRNSKDGKLEPKEEVLTLLGKQRYLLAEKILLDPKKPEESALLGYSVDITERKLTENALNEQWDFIRRVIDTDPNLIFVKDRFGNFLLANKALAELFDTTPEQLQNVANHQVHHHEQEVDNYNKVDLQVIEEQRTIVIEEPFTLNNGKTAYYRTTKTPIKARNGELNVLAISVDITQEYLARKKQKQAKKRKEAQEKVIKASMLKGQEQERERIARELHDSISQLLSTALLQLKEVEHSAEKRQVKSSRENIAKVRQILMNTMQEIREISQNLMPTVLTDFGLQDALKQLKVSLEIQKAVQIDLDIFTTKLHYDRNLEIAIYRITQEALSNIFRHADASKITIQLIEHDKTLHLLIEDDGVGFDLRSRRKHRGHGLINIEQRALALGGQARIESDLNYGTSVIVEIPFVNP